MKKWSSSVNSKFLWLGFGVLCVLVFWFYTLAQQDASPKLTFDLKTKAMENNFSTVHFAAVGNDFGGGFLWFPLGDKLEEAIKIEDDKGNTLYCENQLKGLYYNSQRGERVWPLDVDAKKMLINWEQSQSTAWSDCTYCYDKVELKGGLYTNCVRADDSSQVSSAIWEKENPEFYSIYGKIDHKLNGNPYNLIAGTKYNVAKNEINAHLHCSLQLVNNKDVVGYLYDSQWGIGFVGWEVPRDNEGIKTALNEALGDTLNNGACIQDLFIPQGDKIIWSGGPWVVDPTGSFQDLKWGLSVLGIVGFTENLEEGDQKNIKGNLGSGAQIISTSSKTLSDVINPIRKNAEQLCRNKWGKNPTSELACKNDARGEYIIDLDRQLPKTIVVKNGNVTLKRYMKEDDSPFTLFIDGGNLFLPNYVAIENLLSFNDKGYLTEQDDVVRQGNFLKGNLVVNGLVIGGTWTAMTGIQNKLYLHGKLMSLNTYASPSDERKSYVNSILKNGISDDYLPFIAFKDLFLWRCSDPGEGIASDGSSCKIWKSSHSLASLSIIDQYYTSPLLK